MTGGPCGWRLPQDLKMELFLRGVVVNTNRDITREIAKARSSRRLQLAQGDIA
jgi:hypothetical protein